MRVVIISIIIIILLFSTLYYIGKRSKCKRVDCKNQYILKEGLRKYYQATGVGDKFDEKMKIDGNNISDSTCIIGGLLGIEYKKNNDCNWSAIGIVTPKGITTFEELSKQ